jgi:hypothetical protein
LHHETSFDDSRAALCENAFLSRAESTISLSAASKGKKMRLSRLVRRSRAAELACIYVSVLCAEWAMAAPADLKLKVMAPLSPSTIGPALGGELELESTFASRFGASGSFAFGPAMHDGGGLARPVFGSRLLLRFDVLQREWESTGKEFACVKREFAGCWGHDVTYPVSNISGLSVEAGAYMGQTEVEWGTSATTNVQALWGASLRVLTYPVLGLRWYKTDVDSLEKSYSIGARVIYGPYGVPDAKPDGSKPVVSLPGKPEGSAKPNFYHGHGWGFSVPGTYRFTKYVEFAWELGGGQDQVWLRLALGGVFDLI